MCKCFDLVCLVIMTCPCSMFDSIVVEPRLRWCKFIPSPTVTKVKYCEKWVGQVLDIFCVGNSSSK